MKPGDLVKFRVPDFAKDQPGAGENRPVGIIVDIKNTFPSAGGEIPLPSSEARAIISWTSEKGIWITDERFEHIEVINESR